MRTVNYRRLLVLTALLLIAVSVFAGCKDPQIEEVPAKEDYGYVNPDPTKAQTDAGMAIDGVLDEAAYKENNWLYLNNDDGGNNVNIAMTSHFGEKGMYFVYDVTETVPIYVNTDRQSYMNSCIEMYLAPSYINGVQENSVLEIDLLPTGDMTFKKSNGRYGYVNVATTSDKMACLGTTTKGGEVNTPECYGYTLELFIPWEYIQWLDMDVDSMKNGFVYVNPAHITSNNLTGTDTNLDRYWYQFAQQHGAEFTDVFQYFRFNSDGVIGTKPITVQEAANCTVSGPDAVIPGMMSVITLTPENGHTLTSVTVNGEDWTSRLNYNEDGSVKLDVRGSNDGITIFAKAEPATAGNKTLSGKLIVKELNGGSLKDVVASYMGPTGEKPLEFNEDGSFTLTDVAQGYYVLKAEKEGYVSVSRGILLNKDTYTELELEYEAFYSTKGSCWIMDQQNEGVLQKMGGSGHVMGNKSYYNFTYSAYFKYDADLATQGNTDSYLQQRSGMRIMFSNGKYWHIDLMKEGDKYIVQYAKHTGDSSAFNWRTVHTLSSSEVAQYKSEDGIRLRVMRDGRHAAVWLGSKLLVIELLGSEYLGYKAQLGMEAWVANRSMMEVPFQITAGVPVDVAGSPFHWPANIWDISNQYEGTVTKYPAPGKDTWLDSKIESNDVTVIAKDLTPEANDYSFVYIFKFSNGESFRVRLNHTDDDGKYRIQSFAGSTLFAAWKNHYTLTDEQAQKVMTDGIAYRVQILGTTAYVFLEDEQVCTYDLSTNINTGAPSGIENATSTISFRLDGNLSGETVIPFSFANNYKDVQLNIAETTNGTVTAEKEAYSFGDTVKLTVTGNTGYNYAELKVDDQAVTLDWDGTYSFTATKNVHTISATFKKGPFREGGHWNLTNQNKDLLYVQAHDSGNSGMLQAQVAADDVTTTVQDLTPDAGDFSMIYNFTFSNGEKFNVRLNHTDSDGKYRIQSMSGSTVFEAWKNRYTLTDSEAAKVKGDGIALRVAISGNEAQVFLDGKQVCVYDLSKVISTGKPSNIASADATVAIRMDGNLGHSLEIPFILVNSKLQVQINIAELTGGKVTTDKTTYQVGDTITLTVTPNSGYSQKLKLNGQPLLLDWKTGKYSFVATENVYNITGSFEEKGKWSNNTAANLINEAQGVVALNYTGRNSGWIDLAGEHESITVLAKNLLPMDQSMDANGITGYSMVLRMTFDNGKKFAFRIINDGKIRYGYSRYGGEQSSSGWQGWAWVDQKDAAATNLINTTGAEFKLERTGGNTLVITLNGTVMDTYIMDGITSANTIASVGFIQYGNPTSNNYQVVIPYEVPKQSSGAPVTINIPSFANGTVTADKSNYRVGDKVHLTVTPASGYVQNLTLNGKPLMLDWNSGKASFVATEETYQLGGGFTKSNNWTSNANVNFSNEANGVLGLTYSGNNSGWVDVNGQYKSITVTAKNYLPVDQSYEGCATGGGYRIVLRMNLDNGKHYDFSIWIDTSRRYAYNHFGAFGSETGWSGAWCLIKDKNAAAESALGGEGAQFKLERISGNQMQISINGTVLETYTIPGVTDANKVVSVGFLHYGNPESGSYMVEIPYKLEK